MGLEEKVTLLFRVTLSQEGSISELLDRSQSSWNQGLETFVFGKWREFGDWKWIISWLHQRKLRPVHCLCPYFVVWVGIIAKSSVCTSFFVFGVHSYVHFHFISSTSHPPPNPTRGCQFLAGYPLKWHQGYGQNILPRLTPVKHPYKRGATNRLVRPGLPDLLSSWSPGQSDVLVLRGRSPTGPQSPGSHPPTTQVVVHSQRARSLVDRREKEKWQKEGLYKREI